MLGKLEEEVLLATLQAGSDSLPSEVYARLEAATVGHKSPAFGAVYTTLTRMAAKGLVTEGVKVDQAGRDRRAFTVSSAGRNALQTSVDRFRALGGLTLAGT